MYNVDNRFSKPVTDKCIVLDLDCTLVHTQDDIDSLHKTNLLVDPELLELRSRIYIITLDDADILETDESEPLVLWGVVRPYTKEFLEFCFSYFKVVAVWSAGKKQYVEEIVKHLFKDLPRPHIVFSHDDIEFSKHGNVEKPLVKMFKANNLMSHKNTIVLDDNPGTLSHNPYNGVVITPYEVEPTLEAITKDDDALPKVAMWLSKQEIMFSSDITKHDKALFSTGN